MAANTTKRIQWQPVVFHGGFALLYALGVVFSNLLISSPDFTLAPIWPPAGIAFACLLLGGIKAWPTVAVGFIIGHAFSIELPLLFLAYGFASNLLGPICAVAALRRFWPQNLILIRVRNGMAMALGGVVLSTVAALIGAAGTLHSGLVENASFATIAWQWFLGDLFGVIICSPALLSIGRVAQNVDSLRQDEAFHRLGEKVVWIIGIIVSAFLWVWLSERSPDYALAVSFLPLTFLGWSALRFDHLFTTLAVLVITLAIVTFIGRGVAGFTPPQGALESSILLLFISSLGILPLLVSAAAHQSRYYANQLNYRANHDHLTGLANRNAFEDVVRQFLDDAQRTGRSGAICYFDLDNFKVVNDTCGHTAGDELLKQIAHVLRSNLLNGDYMARLGGDEFGILFLDCDPEQARDRARRLTSLIDEFRFVWRRHIFTFSASCGLAPIGRHSEGFTRLLADADAACFDAKEMGGNRVMMATPDADDTSRHSSAMQWAVKITDALENQLFEVHCQEIVALRKHTDRRVHFEVLVRLRDENGKLLLPATFIPAAERFKLMPRLDRWVIRTTLNKLARNADVIHHIETCSINLSGPSLGDGGFLDYLCDMVAGSAVPARKLCFEITETAAIGDLSHAMLFIDRLRAQGCRFSLDDFGSGLSSFGYLRALQVDYLKIDGAFVRDMVDNPVDRAMVRSINEIGHVMGKETIAEYVDSMAIADILREIGVDYAQGHGFGHAMPIERFLVDRVRNRSQHRRDGDGQGESLARSNQG